jgi:plasmid maintenance system antidote protein VapI
MSVSVVEKRKRAFKVRLALLGMTANEAADQSGMSKSYFSRIMNGKLAATDKMAERLVKVLAATREELFV